MQRKEALSESGDVGGLEGLKAFGWDVPVMRKRLLNWYGVHARDLPWRREPSLYKTLVSEFMLQQTQVKTVLPYFGRWMEAFPDMASLAAADSARVLKLWEGLGYYRRVCQLHRVACMLIAEGEVPRTANEWRKYPGVGPYMAAALASIDGGEAVAVVDGNVIRVLGRIIGEEREFGSAQAAAESLRPHAQALLDPLRPGDFNQAMMELGATVCKRSVPDCGVCPVREACVARRRNVVARIPCIRKPETIVRTVNRGWDLDSGGLVLCFGGQGKRLAGIWELPEVEVGVGSGEPLLVGSRAIANERIRERIYLWRFDPSYASTNKNHGEIRRIPVAELEKHTLSGPHAKWIRKLLDKAETSGSPV